MDHEMLFELAAGPFVAGELAVRELRGEEAISAPYSFDVVATAPREALFLDSLEATLLGQPASLTLKLPQGGARVVHGVVGAFELHGVTDSGERSVLTLTLVPKLALLARNVRSRIFQDLSVPEIVAAVLDDWGIRHTFELTKRYAPRTYCTQYQESDYAFVTRLLADEGIFFFFAHDAIDASATASAELSVGVEGNAVGLGIVAGIGAAAAGVVGAVRGALGLASGRSLERMVLGDDATAYEPMQAAAPLDPAAPLASVALSLGHVLGELALQAASPALVVREHGDALDEEEHHVRAHSLKRSVRSKSTLLSDFDFRKPEMPLRRGHALGAQDGLAESAIASVSRALATGHLGAHVELPSAIDPARMRVYVHHDRAEHEASKTTEIDDARAVAVLDALRADAYVGAATTSCRRVAPGHTFRLEEHAIDRLNQCYVATRVRHEGRTPGRSEAPSARPYECRFECAPAHVVVRPPVPEKRRQVMETAIVVGPPGEEIWTDAYGRIKVQFHWDLDGVRDDKSSCWVRVVQAWTGTGWGAQYVPRVGTEVLVTFLGGDEDRPLVVGCLYNGTHPPPFRLPEEKTRSGVRTATTPTTGGHNEISFEDAAGNEQVRVVAERDLDTFANRDHTEVVGRNHAVRVAAGDTLDVRGDRVVTVGGTERVSIAGAQGLAVAGDADHVFRGDSRVTVKGAFSQVTESNDHHVFIGNETGTAASTHYVRGAHTTFATGRLVLRADEGVVIECGPNRIELSPEQISILANKVSGNATDSIRMKSPGASLELHDAAEVNAKSLTAITKGAELVLGTAAAKLVSDAVQIQCTPDEASQKDEQHDAETTEVEVRVLGSDHAPLAGKTFRLVAGDVEKQGTTGGDGVLKAKVPKTAQVASVRVWTESYPDGPFRDLLLDLQDIPALDEAEGLARRLAHLGYLDYGLYEAALAELGFEPDESGAPNGAAAAPKDGFLDLLSQALSVFQHRNDLEVTGTLDAATRGRIEELHPD